MRVLFHIGLPKAGSTYLQRWFAQHPEIVLLQDLFPIIKKGRWILESDPKLTVLSDERLSGWLKHEAGWGRKCDPNFNVRAYQVRTRDYLFQLNPNADILLVTRAPSLPMLKSIYSQYVKIGGPLQVNEFFDMTIKLINQAFDYDALFDLYCERFPPERILVLPMELMRENLERFLGIIEQHYGLSRFRPGIQRINPALSDEEMLCYRRLNALITPLFSRLFGHRGLKLLLLYIRLLGSNHLAPLARFYAHRHQRLFARQFESLPKYLARLPRTGGNLLERPEFQDYLALYRLTGTTDIHSA